MSESGDESIAEYGLLFPFVVCRSNGGEFDDEAFVCGYETGTIASELRMSHAMRSMTETVGFPAPRSVHTSILPQLDLIAMRYGFAINAQADENLPEWSWIEFTLETIDLDLEEEE